MTRRVWFGVAVVALILGGLVIAEAQAGAQQASCETADLERFDTGGSAPVLFVHGWTGSAATWKEPISRSINEGITPHGRSLAEQVERFEQADGWLLDYYADSARWVSDPQGGGPRVADAIDCLYSMYGEPVTVIAHSMGGLAARWAVDRDDRVKKTASVVTFGTPHSGSDHAAMFATAIGLSDQWTLLDALNPGFEWLIRECGIATGVQVDACSPIPTFVSAFDSPAGRALRTGSDELSALAPWPEGLPVLSLGAEIEIVTQSGGLFYQDLATYHAGDSAVPSASATAMGTERIVRTCRHNIKLGYAPSDDLGQLFRVHHDDNDERSVLGLINTPCWHGKLMTGVELTNDALGFIGEHLPSSPQTAQIRDIDVLNSTLPRGVCGSEGSSWAHTPIPLTAGSGEAIAADGSFGGASATGVETIAYEDFNHDGRLDVLVSLRCFGSPIANCCAGRASILTHAAVLELDANQGLALVGSALGGGSSGFQAPRLISVIANDGDVIVTTESLIYPDLAPADVSHAPYDDIQVRYTLNKGQWLSDADSGGVLSSHPLFLRGMGPVEIGMTLGQAEAALGSAIIMRDQSSGDQCGYAMASSDANSPGLMVVSGLPGFADNTIVRIELREGQETASGIRIGSTRADVLAAYGERINATPTRIRRIKAANTLHSCHPIRPTPNIASFSRCSTAVSPVSEAVCYRPLTG